MLLTTEQKQMMKEATDALNQQQRQQILHWHEKVTAQWDSISLRGEGPSLQKGKAVDAQEWGNISLSEAELDVAAQAAALCWTSNTMYGIALDTW